MAGQAFFDAFSRPVMGYGPGRQTVVAENAQVFREDVGLRAMRLLVIPCLAFKEAIQVVLAAIKAVEHVLAP